MIDAAEIFQWVIENAGYWMVLGLMIVESSFVPFPSEVIVPPAAYLAMTTGDMNIFLVVLVATGGAVIGALVNYYLSMWIGRPVVYKFASSRLGHFFLLSPEKVEKSERYFDRHGAISTFIGRLIPAIRQLISIPAGLARMNIGAFVTFTALGALLWNIVLALLGYWLSLSVPLSELFTAVEQYNDYLTYGGVALGIMCVLFLLYKALVKRTSGD